MDWIKCAGCESVEHDLPEWPVEVQALQAGWGLVVPVAVLPVECRGKLQEGGFVGLCPCCLDDVVSGHDSEGHDNELVKRLLAVLGVTF